MFERVAKTTCLSIVSMPFLISTSAGASKCELSALMLPLKDIDPDLLLVNDCDTRFLMVDLQGPCTGGGDRSDGGGGGGGGESGIERY